MENKLPFLLEKFHVKISGILHVGAHLCEEHPLYLNLTNRILWIEALPDFVERNKKNIQNLNIINAVVSDVDGELVEFNITNNTKCSSMLDLGHHKNVHPEVFVESKLKLKTKKISTLYKENNINYSDYNVLVMDIQGAELPALKGMGDILNFFDSIFIEVAEKAMYEGSCLLQDIDDFLSNLGYERKYLMLLNSYGDAFYLKKLTK